MKNCFIILLALLISVVKIESAEIHGFVSQGYLYSTHYNYISEHSTTGSWELREVGVNVIHNKDNWKIGMQFLSRDVGVYGNNKVVLDWAFGTYRFSELLSLSAGRVKNPTGFFGEVQDFDFLLPWAQLPTSLYDRGLRTLTATLDGVRFDGIIDMNSGGSLEYALLFGIQDMGPETDIEAYATHVGVEGVEEVRSEFKSTVNVVYNTPLEGFRCNFTWGHTENADFTFTTTLDGGYPGTIRREMDMNWFFWGLEYSSLYFDVFSEYYTTYSPFTMTVSADGVGPVFVSDTISRGGGGYVGVNVKPLDWFHVGSYYQLYWDYYDPASVLNDYDLNDPANINRDLAVTLAFHINDNFSIKTEGHRVYGLALLPSAEVSNATEDIWEYGMIKLSCNF